MIILLGLSRRHKKTLCKRETEKMSSKPKRDTHKGWNDKERSRSASGSEHSTCVDGKHGHQVYDERRGGRWHKRHSGPAEEGGGLLAGGGSATSDSESGGGAAYVRRSHGSRGHHGTAH
ncbi:hypothetical protein EGW08_010581, partial [Elysia chlorotica]